MEVWKESPSIVPLARKLDMKIYNSSFLCIPQCWQTYSQKQSRDTKIIHSLLEKLKKMHRLVCMKTIEKRRKTTVVNRTRCKNNCTQLIAWNSKKNNLYFFCVCEHLHIIIDFQDSCVFEITLTAVLTFLNLSVVVERRPLDVSIWFPY